MFVLDFSFFFYFIFVFFFFTLFFLLQVLHHFILVLVFLDLLLLGNILLYILVTILTHNPVGYISALVIIGVAAADTAVGLGLFILYFKHTGQISIENIFSIWVRYLVVNICLYYNFMF